MSDEFRSGGCGMLLVSLERTTPPVSWYWMVEDKGFLEHNEYRMYTLPSSTHRGKCEIVKLLLLHRPPLLVMVDGRHLRKGARHTGSEGRACCCVFPDCVPELRPVALLRRMIFCSMDGEAL